MTNKRCNDPDHKGPRYLPVDQFHKQGIRYGQQQYASKCKVCKNKVSRRRYYENNEKRDWDSEKKRAYSRARSRALSRLAKMTPELYGQLLMEELDREEIDFSKRGHIYRRMY